MNNDHIKYTLPDGTKLPCLCESSQCDDPIWIVFYNTKSEMAYDDIGCEFDHNDKVAPIKQTFPLPPEGREWHNPECLTAEQVEVADRWRLLLKGEEAKGSKFCGRSGHWFPTQRSSVEKEWTYRTKAPLPKVLKVIPLTREEWRTVLSIEYADDDERIIRIEEDRVHTVHGDILFSVISDARRTGHDMNGKKINLFREVEA